MYTTMEEKIIRINELYHLSKERGLNEFEKDEQARLRRDYIDSIKKGLQAQIENIEILEKDGTVTKVTKKTEKN